MRKRSAKRDQRDYEIGFWLDRPRPLDSSQESPEIRAAAPRAAARSVPSCKRFFTSVFL